MLRRVTVQEILAEFALTGRIGALYCNASLTDVAAILGPPFDMGRVSKRTRWPHLFAYGHVELCVCHCRTVTMINVQTWLDTVELPDPQSNTITPYPGRTPYRQITAALDVAGCRWQPVTRQPPGQISLRTEPLGISFTFRTDDGPEPVLDVAGAWTSTHSCAPVPAGHPDDGFGSQKAPLPCVREPVAPP